MAIVPADLERIKQFVVMSGQIRKFKKNLILTEKNNEIVKPKRKYRTKKTIMME
jgi:hypothetical protein